MSDLRKEIEAAVNRCCSENGSDTPDWILADYMIGALRTFDHAVLAREKWYGRARKCTCDDNAGCSMPCDREKPAPTELTYNDPRQAAPRSGDRLDADVGQDGG